ncbi:MAG: carboxymuconolactone decarboxylase family protein [Planctomycetota bacterium]
MARLATVDPASATGRAKEIFEGPLKGKHFNIFKAIANSPAALDFYLAMGGAAAKFSLSPAEQEAVQLTVGEANGCAYCAAAHTAIGKGAGLSEEQTIEARRGHITGDAKLGALTKFASAIHEKRGNVSDDDVSTFKAGGYDDGAVAEVVAIYAFATFTNYFNHVNDTPVDFPAAPAL